MELVKSQTCLVSETDHMTFEKSVDKARAVGHEPLWETFRIVCTPKGFSFFLLFDKSKPLEPREKNRIKDLVAKFY